MERISEAHDWLLSLYSEQAFFRTKKAPSLETVHRFLDHLDRPDHSFAWRVIIGGTAGKGTVTRLTEDVLVRSGKTICTLMSPHLQTPLERIRINGKLVQPDVFAEAVLLIRQTSETLGHKPTYYETLVLAGIWAGKQADCEILLCEVGLGGEFDAVNAVQGKRIAAVTFIGDDHRQILGGTLESIARTKAGIFTAESVLNLSYEKAYRSILEEQAQGPVTFLGGVAKKLSKKLAREICEAILETSDFQMQKVPLPARWEKISLPGEKQIILDGAHSAPRFAYIAPKLKKLTGKKVGIIAITAHHSAEDIECIVDLFDEIIWTEGTADKAYWPAQKLQQVYQRGTVETDLTKALERAKTLGDKIIVTGSFYLCGAIRDLFYPREAIETQQTEFPV